MTMILNVSLATSSSGVSPVWQERDPRQSPRNLAVEAAFAVAAGSSLGTGINAWLQTSIDGGNSFFDIASFNTTAVTTGTTQFIANLSALTPVTTAGFYTPTVASLTTGTVKDGLLGGLYQVTWKSLGTYSTASSLRVDVNGVRLTQSTAGH